MTSRRQEPRLDADLPDDARPGRRRARRAMLGVGRPPHRDRRVVALVLGFLALLLAVVAALWVLREPLREHLLPDGERAQLLERAADALAAGELSRRDGRGARELYLAVLALDPDQHQARSGLQATGRAALAKAEAAAAAGDTAAARAHLQLARELDVPDVDIGRVETRLRRSEGGEDALAALLAQAQAARAGRHGADAVDAALPIYERALEIAPDNAVVRRARTGLLDELLAVALAQVEAGAIDEADRMLARVEAAEPTHLGLPDARARLAEARRLAPTQRPVAARSTGLVDADAAFAGREHLRAGLLYRAAIAEGGGEAARRGLDRSIQALADRAIRAAADFDFDAAEAALLDLGRLAPGSDALRDARARVLRSRARSRALVTETGPVDLSGRLAAFSTASAAGRLLEPPGDSAWDHLRQLRAQAPDDPRVEAAARQFIDSARDCFERRLGSVRLSEAAACLEAVEMADPGAAGLADARRRLAARWIGLAEERLGASQFGAAQRAYDAARARDPEHPGLAALAARLEQARPR